MSLDLDLYAVTHRDGFKNSSFMQRRAFTQILDAVGLVPFVPVDSIPHVTVRLHVSDWHNAYQICKWFTDHVEAGEASYEETLVDLETLRELHGTCKRLLVRRHRQEAEAELPLPADLFENEPEVDKYWRESYWQDVETTVLQLEPILANPKFKSEWEFYYKLG